MQLIRRVVLGIILLTIVIILSFVIVAQVRAWMRYGDAIAACPGPDLFGYRCERDIDIEYIDATNDTLLYEDEGTIVLELPFPFEFYGTTYQEVTASTNGLLYFGEGQRDFRNECPIREGVIEGYGEIIAPYWDDYTLIQAGFLETELVGSAPERIFVIEWDSVPRFLAFNDQVTFQVQLFEGSNDIVFLYDNVSVPSAANGRSATIAIQSEALELSLTAACDQPAIDDDSNISITYPDVPNPDLSAVPATLEETTPPPRYQTAKGEVITLLEQLDLYGGAILYDLETQWLQQSNPVVSEWAWADLTGDGHEELTLLWRRPNEHTQLVVITTAADGSHQQLWQTTLTKRPDQPVQWSLLQLQDRTGDGQPDIILTTADNQRKMISWVDQTFITSP